MYSLRKKFEWCGDGVEGEDCSWVQGEITVCTPKPKATKPKATKAKVEKPKAEKPKKSKKSKKAEVVSFIVNGPAEIDVETMTFGAPEPEPEPEVVEESEESEDDEEVEVRKWNYQGKQYLLDDASGEVYDIETQEVIGTLQEDGTVEFDE